MSYSYDDEVEIALALGSDAGTMVARILRRAIVEGTYVPSIGMRLPWLTDIELPEEDQ